MSPEEDTVEKLDVLLNEKRIELMSVKTRADRTKLIAEINRLLDRRLEAAK